MPDGRTPNQAGMDFYRRLVDTCLENGIEPWVTLYHWDLPLALQKEGGWSNRTVIDDFLRYTEYCVSSLKEVRRWIVLNEPSVFLGAGYLFALHAPGLRSIGGFLSASHHALLCISRAADTIHNINDRNQVGSSFSFTQIQEAGNKSKDKKAAELADTLINRFHFEPVLGLGYPETGLRILQGINKYILPGDEQQMKANLDFIGIQTYTREVFRHNPLNPLLKIKHVPARERSLLLTSMEWEIYPESIYHCISKVNAYNTGLPVYITENGAAFKDKLVLNRVHDMERLDYLQSHIQEVLRARHEGMDVRGYFVWSLLDNFEWAEGYTPRFGLIYVDFETKSRVLKDSALWFRSFLKDRH
jgi:beta-glucosidase